MIEESIDMSISTTLRPNPCFIYFTTNAVFTPIRRGMKKRKQASVAASLSWFGTRDGVEVSIEKNEKKYEQFFELDIYI